MGIKQLRLMNEDQSSAKLNLRLEKGSNITDIQFKVDTGSCITLIGQRYMNKLGYLFDNPFIYEIAKFGTANESNLYAYQVPAPKILFKDLEINLGYVYVPIKKGYKNEHTKVEFCSINKALLGMDCLRHLDYAIMNSNKTFDFIRNTNVEKFMLSDDAYISRLIFLSEEVTTNDNLTESEQSLLNLIKQAGGRVSRNNIGDINFEFPATLFLAKLLDSLENKGYAKKDGKNTYILIK